MPKRERSFTDAEFTVVRGPYRLGEEHRRHKGWYFIGRYDADGDPLFVRKPAPWWRSFQGLMLIAIGAFLALVLLAGVVGAVIETLHR